MGVLKAPFVINGEPIKWCDICGRRLNSIKDAKVLFTKREEDGQVRVLVSVVCNDCLRRYGKDESSW